MITWDNAGVESKRCRPCRNVIVPAIVYISDSNKEAEMQLTIERLEDREAPFGA
jgi:hypothetical protein